jgi:hypothetical protein
MNAPSSAAPRLCDEQRNIRSSHALADQKPIKSQRPHLIHPVISGHSTEVASLSVEPLLAIRLQSSVRYCNIEIWCWLSIQPPPSFSR